MGIFAIINDFVAKLLNLDVSGGPGYDPALLDKQAKQGEVFQMISFSDGNEAIGSFLARYLFISGGY